MFLKPSEIFYTQHDITNTFGKKTGHRYTRIGETLDSICKGRRRVQDIPQITVVKRDGKWFTVDNRRLWVFRHLERLGKCMEIEVIVGTSIPSSKFTTNNGGTSVSIYRGRDPGGIWHLKPTVYIPKPVLPTVDETDMSDSNASHKDGEENEKGVAEKDKVTQGAFAEEQFDGNVENLYKRKAENGPSNYAEKKMKIVNGTEPGTTIIGTNVNIGIKPVTIDQQTEAINDDSAFICTDCLRNCHSRIGLYSHRRTHTTVKPRKSGL